MRQPQLTLRELLYGMFVMNVINGFMLMFLVIALPIAIVLGFWIYAGKIFEPNIAVALGLIATAFFELNVMQLAVWCVRWLFDTPLRRLLTIVGLALWHLVMREIDAAGPFDWALLGVAMLLAIEMLWKNVRAR